MTIFYNFGNFNFGTAESRHFKCGAQTSNIPQMTKFPRIHKGRGHGHVTCFLNFGSSLTLERVELKQIYNRKYYPVNDKLSPGIGVVRVHIQIRL